tara:strand:- start:1186 stop:1878 length:693 start_codon:yes stop_codon:yes gene_type:complete
MKKQIVSAARAFLPLSVRNALWFYILTPLQRCVVAPALMRRNRSKTVRYLEIGPGRERVPNFETLNVVGGLQVDYIANASEHVPFPDNTFDVIFASHVLEHVPWYATRSTLSEWIRTLKSGGRLEIWVPDGELLCQFILDHSRGVKNDAHLDGWNLKNPTSDPFLWANGRLFYGANDFYPSWHQAIFTAASLQQIFRELGLVDVRHVDESEYRGGANHGPINLGVFGTKP